MIPFPSNALGYEPDYGFSARQSRLSVAVVGAAKQIRYEAFYETDLLSDGGSSNEYTLRLRQAWGRLALPWRAAVTGGQMWSLVTETTTRTDANKEKLPVTVDPQYIVGFSWSRRPGIRFQQSFGDPQRTIFTAAASIERTQLTNITANSAVPGAVPADAVLFGTPTLSSLSIAQGVSTNNGAPDLVFKGTLDRPTMHFEVGGIERFMQSTFHPIFKAWVNPDGSVRYELSSSTRSVVVPSASLFGSARVRLGKYVELGTQGMGGRGAGGYGSSQLADATLRPDGSVQPILSYHGLTSVTIHPSKQMDLDLSYGGAYAQRTYYSSATGALIGYGPRDLSNLNCYAKPGVNSSEWPQANACASPTRLIQEGALTLTYHALESPRYGSIQYQVTYSKIKRDLWSGADPMSDRRAMGGTAENMVHLGVRYYLP